MKTLTIAEFEALLASNDWKHEYSDKQDDLDVRVYRESYLGDIWITRIQCFDPADVPESAQSAMFDPSDVENAPFSEEIEPFLYQTYWHYHGLPTIVDESGKEMKGKQLYREIALCLNSTIKPLNIPTWKYLQSKVTTLFNRLTSKFYGAMSVQ